jgi:hypothetical protein
MSLTNRCTIYSSYEFQAHQQLSQRRCCFSQNVLLWFEVLPDAPRFVASAPRCSAMQRDPSHGRREACDSPSEGTRFRQSRQSLSEHLGVSDGELGCCWCTQYRLKCPSAKCDWLMYSAGAVLTRHRTYAEDSQAHLNLDHIPANVVAFLRICKPVSCNLTLQLHLSSPAFLAKWDFQTIRAWPVVTRLMTNQGFPGAPGNG